MTLTRSSPRIPRPGTSTTSSVTTSATSTASVATPATTRASVTTRARGFALGALALGSVWLGGSCKEAAPPPPPTAAASSVDAAWVAVRAANRHALLEIPAVALAPPDARAQISVASRARVLRVLVAPGDEVAAGAPLVEVAYPELAVAAAAHLAAADQLAAQERRRAQLETLRAEGLARVGDLATVEVEIARLRGERDVAAATLRAAGLAPADAPGLVASAGKSPLRAPFAGVVVATDAAIGQLREADGGPLVELAAGGARRIEARITDALPEGAPLRFVAASGGERPARVIRRDPRRDSDGTSRVWLEIEGDDLPAGEPGRLRAVVGEDVVVVPAAAIAQDATGDHVWRRAADGRQRVAVTVVMRSGADALVRGPRVGDEVAARAGGATP